MLRLSSRYGGLALALGAAVAMAACKKNDSGAADTGMAATDTGTAAVADTGMAAAPAPAALSDANIVYILDNANKLDSAAGSIAATKGTAADVRDFGKRMERDHHALRKQGEDLAKKLKVTPEAPANDALQNQMIGGVGYIHSRAEIKLPVRRKIEINRRKDLLRLLGNGIEI